jgi:hypothetical protein
MPEPIEEFEPDEGEEPPATVDPKLPERIEELRDRCRRATMQFEQDEEGENALQGSFAIITVHLPAGRAK